MMENKVAVKISLAVFKICCKIFENFPIGLKQTKFDEQKELFQIWQFI